MSSTYCLLNWTLIGSFGVHVEILMFAVISYYSSAIILLLARVCEGVREVKGTELLLLMY